MSTNAITNEIDESDNVYEKEFEWIADVDRSLTLTSPNGGENWTVGTSQTIRWTSTNAGSNVKIEISRDGGASWSILTNSTPNTASSAYNWTVASPASSNAKIRITSTLYNSVSDISNSSFTIAQPSAIVTELGNGQSVSGSIAQGEEKHYKIFVPSGAIGLTVQTTGTGDIDLYIKKGNKATKDIWDFRPFTGESNETVEINNTTSTPISGGEWYIRVYGYSTSSYTLTATYTVPSEEPEITIRDAQPIVIEEAAINQSGNMAYFKIKSSLSSVQYDKDKYSFGSVRVEAKVITPSSNVKYVFIPIPIKSKGEALLELGVGAALGATPVGWIKDIFDALNIIVDPLGGSDTEFSIKVSAFSEPTPSTPISEYLDFSVEQEYIAQVSSTISRENWPFRIVGFTELSVRDRSGGAQALQPITVKEEFDYVID